VNGETQQFEGENKRAGQRAVLHHGHRHPNVVRSHHVSLPFQKMRAFFLRVTAVAASVMKRLFSSGSGFRVSTDPCERRAMAPSFD
jgi:hypothetical protein